MREVSAVTGDFLFCFVSVFVDIHLSKQNFVFFVPATTFKNDVQFSYDLILYLKFPK